MAGQDGRGSSGPLEKAILLSTVLVLLYSVGLKKMEIYFDRIKNVCSFPAVSAKKKVLSVVLKGGKGVLLP